MVVAGGGATLLSGCKGSPTAASTGGEGAMGKPPVVEAVLSGRVGTEFSAGQSPVSGEAWRRVKWEALVNPGNSAKMTAPAQTAILYDAGRVYVGFICEQPMASHDVVSVFLDTLGTGKEYIEVKTGREGKTSTTWYRASMAPTAREDGSPNFAHPMSTVPGWDLKALEAKTWVEGNRWMAVVAIPLSTLPMPMQTVGKAGAVWRMNCLRVTKSGTTRVESLQSNLSKVYQGAQSVSPYRMAEVQLTGE